MNKPANLIADETRQKITNVINNSGLPAFILEPIIKDLYNQIAYLKKNELENSKKEYSKSLEEGEKNGKSSTN